MNFKTFLWLLFIPLLLIVATGCSINPATGDRQFVALMSPTEEISIGYEEHLKIVRLYGVRESEDKLQIYVNTIGQRLAANTERPEIKYRFYVLDSPMVNAFALPGGYIYISRGLLAQANGEQEVAAVLAHEIAHITARHAAERYSRSVLTSLGASLLASAVDESGITKGLGMGSELYMKSYSRNQERQADELGIRYLFRAEYDPYAMRDFLRNLEQYTALDRMLTGKGEGKNSVSYFSTHPQTKDRIGEVIKIAHQYPYVPASQSRTDYLRRIAGMVYGHSMREGFLKGRDFYHPQMGFTFSIPEGFYLNNQPKRITATNNQGAVIIFDAKGVAPGTYPLNYLMDTWMRGEEVQNPETIKVNGMEAATAAFHGRVDGYDAIIRIMAIKWDFDTMFRFQIAIPRHATPDIIDGLKRTTYSLRALSEAEKNNLKPHHVQIVRARADDSVSTLAEAMPYPDYKDVRFRVLNGMRAGEEVKIGEMYKIIVSGL